MLGGQCFIAATLNDQREIVHLSEQHGLTFGELDRAGSERTREIAELMRGAKFDGHASETIVLDMWEKWVFLTTLAGSTCLMRATIGDIVAAEGGAAFIEGLFEECRAIAEAEGFTPREANVERTGARNADCVRLTFDRFDDARYRKRIFQWRPTIS